MKLIFKQRMFSWFDSYDIYDENEQTVYTVEGQLAWGHCFKIFDRSGTCLGMVKQRIMTFLPKFEIYLGEDCYQGCITKEFAFFKPSFNIDYIGWQVRGDFWEWDYEVVDRNENVIATVSKELFRWTDTYTIEVVDPKNALQALMLVLAIDAEKCSRA